MWKKSGAIDPELYSSTFLLVAFYLAYLDTSLN